MSEIKETDLNLGCHRRSQRRGACRTEALQVGQSLYQQDSAELTLPSGAVPGRRTTRGPRAVNAAYQPVFRRHRQ